MNEKQENMEDLHGLFSFDSSHKHWACWHVSAYLGVYLGPDRQKIPRRRGQEGWAGTETEDSWLPGVTLYPVPGPTESPPGLGPGPELVFTGGTRIQGVAWW
jgi:hypothetical protein